LAPGSSVNQILAWYDGRRGTLANPSLAITSLGGGAGDTVSVTLAVARLAASRGRRAVVIDISAAGSWFQQVSGAGNGPGIAELVQGSADFTKVIVRDAHSSSHLMRYGLDRSERARTALADRLKPVLQALAQSYDTVLLNCGEASQDTPAFVRSASAALIMAPAQQVQAVTSAIASLKSTGYGDVAYVKIEDAGNASAPALGPQFATA
jgi:Mrp family chromosome partitioning ATPase